MTVTDYGYPPSRVDGFTLRDRHFFVKRDDLTDPRYSGNKLRKLTTLLTISPRRYTTLVSYGGAQSNAMLSIAHLARAKGWNFHYYCKKLPEWLKEEPSGNLREALALGMVLHELPHEDFYERVDSIGEACGGDALFIPQGGADPIAEAGVKILAEEILAWAAERGLERFIVATPSGTGTTALYLRRHLPIGIDVVTTPVVGDESVLRAQWKRLEEEENRFPTVLDTMGKWPFAKPRKEYLRIWRESKEAGILFDLIYAPKMWLELLEAYDRLEGPVLYVHSGGMSGNETQLEKYRYKGYL
ncbi:1-aminocyclopropane-1-carboxylate deaminase/D-cysteine desulfhydrase [Hydrogenimonas sp.]